MAVDFARVDNDDYAYRSSSGFNHNAAYTALAWFKIDTNPAQYQHFLNISGSYSYDGNTDFIGTDEVTPILFRYGCAGGSSDSFLTSGVLTVGVWYWCALVRESSTSLKVYRGTDATDGALIATLTNNVGSRASATIMSAGGYNSANINGPIALPRFWSGSAFTLAQLHTEVASYSPAVTTNLWTAPAFSGANFTEAMADLSGNARDWTRNGTDSTIVADPISPGGSASQSIAFTLDGVTASIGQTATHPQALAFTLDDVAISIAQTAQHPQSLAITLDDVGVIINQSNGVGKSQSIDFTLDDVVVAIAQTANHPQSLSVALDGVTVAIAQTAQHPQALAIALDGVSVAINQGLSHSQALAATLDGVAVDIQQSLSPAAKDQALAIVLDGVVVSIDQIGPDNLIDTHDGFWVREWKKMIEREKKLNIEDVIEIVEESPQEVLEALPEVKREVKKEFGRVDYQKIANNLRMQTFIAERILIQLEVRKLELEEDDLEVLLLM